MSNTVEATVIFTREMLGVAKREPMVPVLALALGTLAGNIAETHLSSDNPRNQAQGRISAVLGLNHEISNLEQKAQQRGDLKAQSFLQQTRLDNLRQVASIRANEPKAPSTLEHIGYYGGWALLGLVALSALVAGKARSYSRQSMNS